MRQLISEPRSQVKRTPPKGLAEKSCLCCEEIFKPKRRWQRFCSPECRLIFWAANKFYKAFCEGRAEGLKPLVKKLGS